MCKLKRIITLLLALSLLFSTALVLVACDSPDNGDDSEINNPNNNTDDSTDDNTNDSTDDNTNDNTGDNTNTGILMHNKFAEFWESVIVKREREIEITKYALYPEITTIKKEWHERKYANAIFDTLRAVDVTTFSNLAPAEISSNLSSWIDSQSACVEFYFFDGSEMVLNLDDEGIIRVSAKEDDTRIIFYTKCNITQTTIRDVIQDIKSKSNGNNHLGLTPITVEEFKELWNGMIVERKYHVEKIDYRSKHSLVIYYNVKNEDYIDELFTAFSKIDLNTVTLDIPEEIADNLDVWLKSRTYERNIYFYEYQKYDYRLDVYYDDEGYLCMILRGDEHYSVFYAKYDFDA